MDEMDSDDEEETIKSKVYFSTKGIGLMGYMLLVLNRENDLGDLFSTSGVFKGICAPSIYPNNTFYDIIMMMVHLGRMV